MFVLIYILIALGILGPCGDRPCQDPKPSPVSGACGAVECNDAPIPGNGPCGAVACVDPK
jgi:hypothetical protein